MDDYRYCMALGSTIHWYRRVTKGRYLSACGWIYFGNTPGGYVGHAAECPDCVRILDTGRQQIEQGGNKE